MVGETFKCWSPLSLWCSNSFKVRVRAERAGRGRCRVAGRVLVAVFLALAFLRVFDRYDVFFKKFSNITCL